MRLVKQTKPQAMAQRTDRQIADQGFTYNETGKTYNEIGMIYGGAYGHDVVPMVTGAKLEKSSAHSITDYPNTLPVRILVRGQSMGLLLDLTYPTSQVIYL